MALSKTRFTLTADHIRLLRRANVTWDSAEFGAPAIDPKRPFGNSSVVRDIHEILGWPLPEDEEERERHLDREGHGRAVMLYRQLETALQVVLATGSFEPGVYEVDNYNINWRKVTS